MIVDEWVLNLVRNKDVLDLGALGNWRDNLKKNNLDNWSFLKIFQESRTALGIDLDKTGVDFANKHGFTNIIYGNAEKIDLNKKFDVIIAGDIIEHVDNMGSFLNSCKKHMHRNSIMLISTPNPYALNFIFWSLFSDVGNRIQPEHTSCLHEKNLRVLLDRADLRVTNIRYYTIIDKRSLRLKLTSRLIKFIGSFRKQLNQAYMVEIMLK
ncbi:MAG: class I SAM-dependent methyltransferase [Candidatus Micrarchaeia archaeon]